MSRAKVTVTWQTKEIEKLTRQALTAGFREAGKFARRGIKANLSGPSPSGPGSSPGRVSGDLRKAVSYRVKTRAGKYVAMDVGVVRPSPYDRKYPGEAYAKALRLARGFVGKDRLGRTFNQRPRPFVDPFVNANRKQMADLVERTASTWMPKAKKER